MGVPQFQADWPPAETYREQRQRRGRGSKGPIIAAFAVGCLVGAAVVAWAVVRATLNRAERAAVVAEEDLVESPGAKALAMLALADQLQTEHAKQMWIMAANMANDGYTFSGSKEPVGMNVADLTKATAMMFHVSPPGANKYRLQWRLQRLSGSSGTSFLLGINEHEVFDRAMFEAFRDEWLGRISSRFSHEVHAASYDLLFTAWRLHQRDSGREEAHDGIEPGVAVEHRGWNEERDYYTVVVSRHVGGYELRARIIDNHDARMCSAELAFTHLDE